MNLKISLWISGAALLSALGCSLTDTSELGAGGPDASAGASGADAASAGAGGSGAGSAGGAAGSAGAGGASRPGDHCERSDDCPSGFCVDGVCCDSACDGACEACSAANKGSGADGVCGPVGAGGDPDAECEDEGPTSCGRTGSCDGAGACARYSTETQCSDSTCAAGVRTPPGSCDGQGSCVAAATEACQQGTCDGPVCLGQCQSDAACPTGNYCEPASGACTPKLPNGDACQSNQANRCVSGICVDGVCCDATCDGRCEGCATGTCTPHAAGVDPDSDCSADAAATCGQDGSCDGARGCQLYASNVQCAPASCVGTSYAAPATCSGSGSCSPPAKAGCEPFICSGNTCRTSCSSSVHCAEGNYCIVADGKCVPLIPQGKACETNDQCKSGFCVDGVCCDRACNGLCEACTEAKTQAEQDGVCSLIKEKLDPDNECVDQGVASCGQDGTCDGRGQCRLYPEATKCGATCVSGSLSQLVCKEGSCQPSKTLNCSPYLCVGAACTTSCKVDADCASGKTCVGSACVSGLAQGASCNSDAQCGSGHCVDRVCCDTSCSGTCKTCDASLALRGTCSNVVCGPVGFECFKSGERCVNGACGSACLVKSFTDSGGP